VARLLVRTADLVVGGSGDILVTEFVGSCVVIMLHDSVAEVGGMAHVLLDCSRGTEAQSQPGKFADVAVGALVDAMERRGALRFRMTASIAGGANMFPAITWRALDIGARNVQAVFAQLSALSIPVVMADVGGSQPRRVVFDISSGMVRVNTGNATPAR